MNVAAYRPVEQFQFALRNNVYTFEELSLLWRLEVTYKATGCVTLRFTVSMNVAADLWLLSDERKMKT